MSKMDNIDKLILKGLNQIELSETELEELRAISPAEIQERMRAIRSTQAAPYKWQPDSGKTKQGYTDNKI